MLNPDSRTLFHEALRPPDGFELDAAIATTYSLDLTAMLLAPLAFARLDGFTRPIGEGQSQSESIDPFALLKTIRTFAERTTVFCQSGQISVPRGYQRLFAYLEQSVVQVTPKSRLGVFHPKVWALRMVGTEGAVRYRVLCLSRNLTFDTSWDTALVLDGELTDRKLAIAANHPLGDFFKTLPSLAVGKVSPSIRKTVDRVSDELRRVAFEAPENFDRFIFAPIGIGEPSTGMPFLDDRVDNRLVISPFASSGLLARLPGTGGTLVSRLEELDELPAEALERFEQVFVLADALDQLEDSTELETAKSNEFLPPPNGLHAKLFVHDGGRESVLWTGSANATNAAFAENVEFLIGLVGKKSKVGIDSILEALEGAPPTIPALLVPYSLADREGPKATPEKDLEAKVRQIRADCARTKWVARVSPVDDGHFSVSLEGSPQLNLDAELAVRPITLPDTFTQSFAARTPIGPIMFPRCSFDALTSFFALRLTIAEAGLTAKEDFVVHAELIGAPENRLSRVLDSMLSDPAKVLRFLRLLLVIDPLDILGILTESEVEAEAVGSSGQGRNGAPILESLLAALAREPAKLAAVGQLVDDLTAVEGGLARFPVGFMDAWAPIRDAHVILSKGKS